MKCENIYCMQISKSVFVGLLSSVKREHSSATLAINIYYRNLLPAHCGKLHKLQSELKFRQNHANTQTVINQMEHVLADNNQLKKLNLIGKFSKFYFVNEYLLIWHVSNDLISAKISCLINYDIKHTATSIHIDIWFKSTA